MHSKYKNEMNVLQTPFGQQLVDDLHLIDKVCVKMC